MVKKIIDKIIGFFKSRTGRNVAIAAGITAAGIAGMAYRRRWGRTDLPASKYHTGERGEDRVSEGIHRGIRDSIGRLGEGIERERRSDNVIRELGHEIAGAAENIEAELGANDRREREIESGLEDARDTARRAGGRIDRIGELGRSAAEAHRAAESELDRIESAISAKAERTDKDEDGA